MTSACDEVTRPPGVAFALLPFFAKGVIPRRVLLASTDSMIWGEVIWRAAVAWSRLLGRACTHFLFLLRCLLVSGTLCLVPLLVSTLLLGLPVLTQKSYCAHDGRSKTGQHAVRRREIYYG